MRYIFLFLFVFHLSFAQEIKYSIATIPENLKENANSIVRFQSVDINIKSQKSIEIKTMKVVTIVDKKGLSNIDAYAYYSKSEKVNAIQATILNAVGKEIKKIKRQDFRNQSIADGFSVLTDDRIYNLNYTPTEYPFTIVFESETESPNTAFIPSYYFIDDYYESVQKSEITIHYPSDLGFKYKEFNFEGRNIVKTEKPNEIKFAVDNLPAEKPEDNAPDRSILFPHTRFGLDKFFLEGVEGTAKSWQEYGSWIYNNLLSETEIISNETKNRILAVIGTETDPIKKAKMVYKYVQDKTRYVSIQLGIGGWKPMLAQDVDRLGYGDCKALSNYTRVLLKTVGVESFYTIIYAGENKIDLDKDFVSMQGNHAILTLNNQGKNYFLECTSQTTPFNYKANFTDDRCALIVKPDSGEIIVTASYNEKENSQISKGNYEIDANGNFSGTVLIKSQGTQYDKFSIESESKEKKEAHYKNNFSWINNLKIENIKFNNDKENIVFMEDIKLTASDYGNQNGTTMMFALNVFNQTRYVPQRYRNRKNAFEISRGYYDQDEIEISLPIGYTIDAQPENIDITSKFGAYKFEISKTNSNKLLYKRSFLLNKGKHDKAEYENYRLFREKIAKADQSKIVLVKK